MRRAFFPIIVVVAALGIVGCRGAKQTPETTASVEQAAVSVMAEMVGQRDLQETVDVTGTLKAANEVTVGPRVPGKLIFLAGKAGAPVRKGEVVARLDNADARIQVRAADAAVRAAKARLAQAKAAYVQQQTATDVGIVNAQAAVDAAKARLQQSITSYNAQKIAAEAQVAQATQGVNAAKSRQSLLQNGARPQDRQIADNNVRLAEASYNNDVKTYNRYKQLFDDGAVSKATLDAFDTKVQVSKAQLDSARQQAEVVKVGARQEDLDSAQAAVDQAQAVLESARAGLAQVDVAKDSVAIARTGVEQAEAALKSAKASVNLNVMRDRDVAAAAEAVLQAQEMKSTAEQALSYTQVVSPVNGVVGEVLAEVGQSVGANAPVLKLVTNSALYFEAQVSELDAPRIAMGQTVLITIDAMQGNRANVYGKSQPTAIAGSVERVVPVIDARSRNFTVRVFVADTPALYPGMFARGQIVTAEHKHAVVIPKNALMDKDDKHVVFVAGSDKRAYQREVVIGAADGEYLQITSGLQAGEEVIVEGQQALRDGDPIEKKAQATESR